MMGKLILARHHESEWNKLGKWTGKRDRHLTEYGFEKSNDMGLLIQDMKVDQAFASMQVRSIETLSCMLNVCNRFEVPTEHSAALNERDYGDYTGKNKFEMEEMLGEEEYKRLRRGWDYPIPNGESLKMVYERTVPYFMEKILPRVKEGKNVLVVAHGNSLRSLIKYVEQISDEGIADVEMPFGAILVYDLDADGHMTHKEIRKTESPQSVSKVLDGGIVQHSRAQIVATIGPASAQPEILKAMIAHQLDVVRLNFSWGDLDERTAQIALVRQLAKEAGRRIPIIVDVPGPRVQEKGTHSYDANATSALTEHDADFIRFAAEQQVEYVAVSFVGSARDIEQCREIIAGVSGRQKIIAKIERAVAVENLAEIISAADAIMVARGDLGTEIPLEKIPMVQEQVIRAAKAAGKPVITATQMLLSMVHEPEPTRAEVTDVHNAIMQGSDAVMLSEETTIGSYPVEAVTMMEKIVAEAEREAKQNGNQESINFL